MPLDVIQQLNSEAENIKSTNPDFADKLSKIAETAKDSTEQINLLQEAFNKYSSDGIDGLENIIKLYEELSDSQKKLKDFIKSTSDINDKFLKTSSSNASSLNAEIKNFQSELNKIKQILSNASLRNSIFKSDVKEGEKLSGIVNDLHRQLNSLPQNKQFFDNKSLSDAQDIFKQIFEYTQKIQDKSSKINIPNNAGAQSVKPVLGTKQPNNIPNFYQIPQTGMGGYPSFPKPTQSSSIASSTQNPQQSKIPKLIIPNSAGTQTVKPVWETKQSSGIPNFYQIPETGMGGYPSLPKPLQLSSSTSSTPNTQQSKSENDQKSRHIPIKELFAANVAMDKIGVEQHRMVLNNRTYDSMKKKYDESDMDFEKRKNQKYKEILEENFGKKFADKFQQKEDRLIKKGGSADDIIKLREYATGRIEASRIKQDSKLKNDEFQLNMYNSLSTPQKELLNNYSKEHSIEDSIQRLKSIYEHSKKSNIDSIDEYSSKQSFLVKNQIERQKNILLEARNNGIDTSKAEEYIRRSKETGSFNNQTVFNAIKKLSNTEEGKNFLLDKGILDKKNFANGRTTFNSKFEVKDYGTLLMHSAKKLSEAATKLNEAAKEFANIRIGLARVNVSGQDVFGGSINKYQNEFGLTRKQTLEVAPAIESFIRKTNSNMEVVNQISDNLKNANGVLKPEDLKNALQSMQGMTQGQINSITGSGNYGISDSLGAAFTLMENPQQLDSMIKAMSSGAFSGDIGVEDNDKKILEANQHMNVILEDIRDIMTKIFGPINSLLPFLGKGLATILGAIGTLATVRSLGGLTNLIPNVGGKGAVRNLIKIFGKTGAKNVLNAGSKIASMGGKIGGLISGAGGIASGVASIVAPLATAGLVAYGGHQLANSIHQKGQNKIKSKIYNSRSEQEKALNRKLMYERDRKHSHGLKAGWAGAAAGATAGAMIGQALIPIPVLGAAIGSAIGSAIGFGSGYIGGRNLGNSKEKAIEKEIEMYKKTADTLKKIHNEHLSSLKALKSYQTLIEQIKRGAYTKFEDAMVSNAEKSIELYSIGGGTNEGFESAKQNIANFATTSYAKNMAKINKGFENLNKGYSVDYDAASGQGNKLRSEEKIAAYNALLNQQIEITKKWISSIEKSIGQYDKIPSVILNNMKNKIDQFQFAISQMGVGSTSGTMGSISNSFKRIGESMADEVSSFIKDETRINESTQAYKEQNLKKYNNAVSSLNDIVGYNYIDKAHNVDELGNNKKEREKIKKIVEASQQRINDVLKSDEFASLDMNIDDVMEMENHNSIQKLNKRSDKGVVIDLARNLAQRHGYSDFETFADKNDEAKKLKKNLEKGDKKSMEAAVNSMKKLSNDQALASGLLKRYDDNKIKIDRLHDMTGNDISAVQTGQSALSADDGRTTEVKNKAKIREEMLKRSQENMQKYSQNLKAAMNTSGVSMQNQSIKELEAGFYGQQMSGNAAESVNSMLGASMKKYNEQAKNLNEYRNNFSYLMSGFAESSKKSIEEAGLNSEEEVKAENYSEKLQALQKARLDGDTKTAGIIQKELEDIRSSSQDPKTLAVFEAMELKSGEIISHISEYRTEQAKVESDRRRSFEQILAKMKDLDTNTSKMYAALAKSQETAVKVLGRSASGRSAISSIESDFFKNIESNFNEKLAQVEKYQTMSLEDVKKDLLASDSSLDEKKASEMAIEYKANGATIKNELLLQKQTELENGFKAMIEAKNILLDLRDESINYQKDFANLVGAPIGTILALEQETVRTQQERYQNAKETYDKLLATETDSAVLQKAANAVAKEQLNLAQKTTGLQRGFIEKMFGGLTGQVKSSVGFIGSSLGSKYGAGYSVNAAGTMVATGKQNKDAHSSYAERIYKNQFSALGDNTNDNSLDSGIDPSKGTTELAKIQSKTAYNTKEVADNTFEILKMLQKSVDATESKNKETKEAEAKNAESKPSKANKVEASSEEIEKAKIKKEKIDKDIKAVKKFFDLFDNNFSDFDYLEDYDFTTASGREEAIKYLRMIKQEHLAKPLEDITEEQWDLINKTYGEGGLKKFDENGYANFHSNAMGVTEADIRRNVYGANVVKNATTNRVVNEAKPTPKSTNNPVKTKNELANASNNDDRLTKILANVEEIKTQGWVASIQFKDNAFSQMFSVEYNKRTLTALKDASNGRNVGG